MPPHRENILDSTIPSVEEDPAERRRLLNVLAQRRYRSRKKVRVATEERSDAIGVQIHQGANTESLSLRSANVLKDVPEPIDADDVPWDLLHTTDALGLNSYSATSFEELLALDAQFPLLAEPVPPNIDTSVQAFTKTVESGRGQREHDRAQDTSLVPYQPQYASRKRAGSSSLDFSDEAYINTHELPLLNAHFTIIQRINQLGFTVNIWNPYEISPFCQSSDIPNQESFTTFPENYRPTQAQKLIKHHPCFDLLPWPSVRDSILAVLNLPTEAKPEKTQDDMPNIVMKIVMDMKDAAGGLRVWGVNPFDERNWEVGQTFFDSWWWALNGHILKNSNELRKIRGVGELRFKEISS